MTTKIRPRVLAVMTTCCALLAVVAVTASSSGAAEPTVVRLNLGTDGRYFEYGPTRQNLTVPKSGCQLNSPETVINLSSNGGTSPGLANDSIGVKSTGSNANGTPCGQVDSVETLTMQPGSSLAGKLFKGVRLDLEMTGNARVVLRFSGGATGATPDQYVLQTGTSIDAAQRAEWTPAEKIPPYLVTSGPGDQVDACAAPNSSGPNSGANDNCQWTVWPLKTFDTVSITTTVGTASFEGGGDFPTGQDRDSLFYLANSGPTAVNDSYSTNEDTTLSGDVTDNDTDPDGDTLTNATVASAPAHGSVNLASNGTFSYQPASNYFGPDSFTYTASDGGVTSNTATVSINVTPVNDPPVPHSSSVTTPEETTKTITVATDVDDAVLTTSCTRAPAVGTVHDNGDGTVSFTPPLDFTGTVVLTCTTTDGAGATTSSSATVNVGVTGVNDAPIGVADTAEILANAPSVSIDVLANDTDVDSADLQVTDIAGITPVGASVVVNGDGTVTYSPPASNPPHDFTTSGSFTYKAIDGGGLKSGVTAVTITPIMCSEDEVSDSDGDVTGTFTRLTDPFACKQFTLTASNSDDTVLFQPSGASQVVYRGVVSFGADVNPPAGADSLRLRYDPTGGFVFQPMKWCLSPQFDESNILETEDGFPLFAAVTSATLPAGEGWCIASAYTRSDGNGDKVVFWQIYGIDDPRATR